MTSPNQIILQLTIVEGRNLAPKDRSGTSDPYVTLKLRDADNRTDKKQKYKTKILGKTLNPVWNQTFLLYVEKPNTKKLILYCWDKDKYSTDDYMGEIEIPISAIVEKSYMYSDIWMKLVAAKKGEEVSGDIHLQINMKSCSESERVKVYEANKSISLTPTPTRAHRVTIDKLPFGTFYEKFEIDSAGQLLRTPQELVFEFGLHCILYPLLLSSSSQARVVEVGSFNEIEILREGLAIDKQKEETIRKRVDRYGMPGKESQLVELQYRLATIDQHPFYNKDTFKSPEFFQKWRKSEIEIVHKMTRDLIFSEKRFGARLIIKVIEGKDMPAKDLNGKSDPYCIITVQGEKKKTKIKSRTLNPVWNQTLEFDITDPNTKVLLEVWDNDLTSKDDLMCRLVLPLNQFESPSSEKNKWYQLETKGQIHLEIDYQYPFSSYLKFSEEMLSNNLSQDTINTISNYKGKYTVDHNTLYNFLVKTLILYTKDLDEIVTLEGEALLEEYATRYGISNLYKNLCYLLNLRLQPRAQLLHTIESMISDLNKMNRNQFTQKEEEMFDSLFEQMLIRIQSLFTQFKEIFPKNTPAGCVSALSSIVVLLHPSSNGAIETLKKWLTSYINTKWETIVMSSKHPDSQDNVLSPVELRMIAEKVIQELNTDVYFKDSFPSDFNYLAFSAMTYHDLMRTEIESLCERNIFHDEIFKLYFKLKEFISIVKSRVSSEVISLSKCFVSFVYTWMRDLRNKETEYVHKALSLDKKEAISKEDLYSSSVVDIFSSLIQSLEFLQSLDIEDTFLVNNYLELSSQIISLYNAELSKEIMQDIEKQWPEHSSSILPIKMTSSFSKDDQNAFKRNAPIAITVTPQLCVSINNIEGTRQQLDKFANVVEDVFLSKIEKMARQDNAKIVRESYEKCTREAFKKIKENLLTVVQFLVSNMQFFIEKSLLNTLVNETDHALFDYLDELFSVLSDNLYEDIFKKVLQTLWVSIAGFLREVILGERKGIQLETEQLHHLAAKYEDLREYFYADGNGLTQKFLDEKTQFVRKLIHLVDMETSDLIDIFSTMNDAVVESAENNEEIVKGEHVLIILKQRKNDKEAAEFLKELKRKEKNKNKPQKQEESSSIHSSGEKKMTKKEAEQEELRKRFLLQETEVIFDEWNVSHDSKTGFLLLTTTYLLFDAFFGGGPDGGHQIAIYLKEIKEMKRTKKFLYEVIDVIAKDGTEYSFSSINNREDMIRDIKAQAQKAGNKIWK